MTETNNLNLNDFFELVNYKITEGSVYSDHKYGPDLFCFDYWNKIHDEGGLSFSVVFNTKTCIIFEMTACEYGSNLAFKWVNPLIPKMDPDLNDQAWDNVNYTHVTDSEVFLEIGKIFIDRVQIFALKLIGNGNQEILESILEDSHDKIKEIISYQEQEIQEQEIRDAELKEELIEEFTEDEEFTEEEIIEIVEEEIALNMNNSDMLQICLAAHKLDLTLNQFINMTVKQELDRLDRLQD